MVTRDFVGIYDVTNVYLSFYDSIDELCLDFYRGHNLNAYQRVQVYINSAPLVAYNFTSSNTTAGFTIPAISSFAASPNMHLSLLERREGEPANASFVTMTLYLKFSLEIISMQSRQRV
jgi:hypothetical protein